MIIPYCSGDFYLGTSEALNEGFYLMGHKIFSTAIDKLALLKPNGLSKATDIIVIGYSAGGMGAMSLLDELAAQFPSARVTGISNLLIKLCFMREGESEGISILPVCIQ